MLSNNATARMEGALTRGLPPSDRVCWVPRCRWRWWRRWRCLPGCYATPAGELPRLTYTLFILTLLSGAFVILSEELVPQRRVQAAASPAPFPELGFRDAPLHQDTQASEPRTSPILLAENGHSSGHMWDAPGVIISPCPMACSPWCGLLINCGRTITVRPSGVGIGMWITNGDQGPSPPSPTRTAHSVTRGCMRWHFGAFWWFSNGFLPSRNLGKSGLRVSCLGLGKCQGLPQPLSIPLVPCLLPALLCGGKERVFLWPRGGLERRPRTCQVLSPSPPLT